MHKEKERGHDVYRCSNCGVGNSVERCEAGLDWRLQPCGGFGPIDDNEMTDTESPLDELIHHFEVCTQCQTHRGHMPLGFCKVGLDIFEKLNDVEEF